MVSSTPDTPAVETSSTTDSSVKIPTKDLLILTEEAEPIELMTDLVFEDIGGQEIINIARNDTVNGQKIMYQPIKNLTSLYLQYNPQNILSLQNTSEAYFKNFGIPLEDKIPDCGTGYDLVGTDPDLTKRTKVPNCKIVYIEPETGNLVINIINLSKGEQIEVEIQTQGSRFSDTIYEVNN